MRKLQAKLLLDYRVSPNKIILGHIDLMEDCEYVFELLDMRIYVEFDHIGRNEKHDDWVVGTLKNIKDRNQLHKMILSQDMGKKIMRNPIKDNRIIICF